MGRGYTIEFVMLVIWAGRLWGRCVVGVGTLSLGSVLAFFDCSAIPHYKPPDRLLKIISIHCSQKGILYQPFPSILPYGTHLIRSMSHQYDPAFSKAKAKMPLSLCPLVFVSFWDVEVFFPLFFVTMDLSIQGGWSISSCKYDDGGANKHAPGGEPHLCKYWTFCFAPFHNSNACCTMYDPSSRFVTQWYWPFFEGWF